MKKLLSGILLGLVLLLGLFNPRPGNAKIHSHRRRHLRPQIRYRAHARRVFELEKKNGAAIFCIVSGGFFSGHHNAINPAFYKAFLDRGYTVFAVVHGSQPRYIIPEIEQDIHRSIRFVRHNAARWGVDTNKFGITGGSAGGHLSLTIGTQGGPGKADAKDPVDRESSAVQAVACFFPPTDFLNWSKPDEDWMDFEATRQFEPAFGPKSKTHESRQELGREISPIQFVTSNMAPTLVMHGDADKLVPIYQSQIFEKKCREVGAPFKLIVKPGGNHGWAGTWTRTWRFLPIGLTSTCSLPRRRSNFAESSEAENSAFPAHRFQPSVRHERSPGGGGMHSVLGPIFRRGEFDGVIKHGLKGDEGGVEGLGHALGGGAITVEFGKPLVTDGAAPEDEWLANDEFQFGQRLVGAFEQRAIILFVNLHRALHLLPVSVCQMSFTPMRMLRTFGLRSRQSASQRSAS